MGLDRDCLLLLEALNVDFHYAVGGFICKRNVLALFRHWCFQAPPRGMFLRSLTWTLEDISTSCFVFIWLGTCFFAHVVWFFDEIVGFIKFFGTSAFVDTGGPTLVNDNPLG